MSCLSLRLPPAKKAWKSFTSKLQSKLHILHKSKVIKKSKTRRLHPPTDAKSAAISPSPFLGQLIHRKRYLLKLQPPKPNHALRFRYRYPYPFKKKAATAPVYIDRLFKEPIAAEFAANKYPRIAKNVKVLEQKEARAAGAGGTSNNINIKEEKGCASTADGDDMWESLALASPQMNGIDQRAEDFIQRFRAEMERQEMIARRL